MTKRFGFTLAEVLITLGIIGVVAAMTIPTLIKNYQKTVWVNQLKKSVSTIENGFKLMLADEGVEDLYDTNIFKAICNGHEERCKSGESFSLWEATDKTPFLNGLSKYFKFVETYTDINKTGFKNRYKYLSGNISNDYFFDDEFGVAGYLQDGTLIIINGALNSIFNNNQSQDIIVDVNGKKGPNQFGRDVFVLKLNNSGNISPYKAATYNQYEHCNIEIEPETHGTSCAARIIENGWKMDY